MYINSLLFLLSFITTVLSKVQPVNLNMYSSFTINVDTPESITTKLTTLRNSFRENKTKSYKWRIEQLKQFKRLIVENEKDLADALFKDLGRPHFEIVATDLVPLIVEIDYAISNLHKWMKPTNTLIPAALLPATSEYIHEPYRVCLIIGMQLLSSYSLYIHFSYIHILEYNLV